MAEVRGSLAVCNEQLLGFARTRVQTGKLWGLARRPQSCRSANAEQLLAVAVIAVFTASSLCRLTPRRVDKSSDQRFGFNWGRGIEGSLDLLQ